MGLLIFSLRKQEIIRRKSQIEYRLMTLSQKMQDLQQYSSLVGSGPVSLNSLMNTPTSLFGRMTSFMTMTNKMAMAQAQRQMQYTMSVPGAAQQIQASANGDPQAVRYYENMMLNSYYQNAMQQSSARESQLLNAQETKIQSEMTRLQEQAKMLDEEMKGLESSEDGAIKALAPKYA